jgi:hypothetical protein
MTANPTAEEMANADADGPTSPTGEEGYYFVGKILGEKWDEEDQVLKYKIRWQGYDSDEDTYEPASGVAHCKEKIAEWEASKKAKQAQQGISYAVLKLMIERKRSRSQSNKSGDESGSGTGRSKKRAKSTRSSTSSKRQVDVAAEDDESDVSKGTDDSFMNELKSKNEGTFKFKDVQPHKETSDSDSESIDQLKDKERQRRQAKREAKPSSLPKKRTATVTATKPAPIKPPVKPITPGATSPEAPHFPFDKRSLNAIKPAKRKPGETAPNVQSDDRRQKVKPPLTLMGRNNLKKKQRQEPPPDTSAIATFRPNTILTKAARNMRSGRGIEKAVGDIDTAILAQTKDTSPIVEEPKATPERKSVDTTPTRRNSVSDAIARAAKIRDEEGQRTASQSPISPFKPLQLHSDDAETALLSEAWQKGAGPPPSPTLRRASYSAEPRPPRPAPPRLNSTGKIPTSAETSPIDPAPVPMVDVLPTLTENDNRTWTGELLFSKENSSLGTIRLAIPQSSVKIKQLPAFSNPSICLRKMLSVQYLAKKWFSATVHPSKKPDCLLVHFQNRDSEKTLVDALRATDSAGLVLEETFTLLFFFKQNDRLRNLFNNDSTSNIAVALLPGLNLTDLETPVHPSAEVFP